MAKQLRLRRGTTAEHSTFTGVAGEITYDTTKNTVIVHDGSTAGGTELAKAANLTSLTASFNATISSNVVAKSSNVGAALLPVGSTGDRPTAANGMIRYNNTLNQFEGYGASGWGTIGGGAVGGTGNAAFYENDSNITADYSITAGKNAMSAGPITINAGITVTVPANSTWTVV